MVAFQQTCRMSNPGDFILKKMSDCSATPAVNLREDINLYRRPSQRSPHATLTSVKNYSG